MSVTIYPPVKCNACNTEISKQASQFYIIIFTEKIQNGGSNRQVPKVNPHMLCVF